MMSKSNFLCPVTSLELKGSTNYLTFEGVTPRVAAMA